MLTRRKFLATSVAASGALALSACKKDEPSVQDQASAASDVGVSTPSIDDQVNALLDKLSLEQRVAQLFLVRPEAITGIGTQVQAGDTTKQAFEKYPVAGCCYFAQNLQDPEQTRKLLHNSAQYAQDAAQGLPLFISVDEEGGEVARIANAKGNPFGVTQVNTAQKLGATGDAHKAADAALTISDYLNDLGFNLDFAPVCDVANNPNSATMRTRSFGADADVVASMVEVQVKAYLDAGILCCAKHFPGIGGAVGDSENEAISSAKTLAEMDSCELKPFKAAIAAGVPLVMVGHLSCPAITGNDRPASLSPAIIHDVLREHLGYGGVIITDSFEMGAVHTLFTPERQGVEILKAGADLILMPIDFKAAYQGVLDALKAGELTEDRINESFARVAKLKLEKLAR